MSSAKGNSLAAASDTTSVDKLNSEFYNRIEYPGPVHKLERFAETDLWPRMLGQDIGEYGEPLEIREIWVAGCGRNQALITALKFPEAHVLGTDLSESSLTVCRAYADALGVTNLTLEKASINDCSYSGAFDYVISTGVIHHNAHPSEPLTRLSSSLKPRGLLELMVYNEYHRLQTSAFQQVVRTLVGTSKHPDFDREVNVAKKLVAALKTPCAMTEALQTYNATDIRPAYFADSLLQPVEHSYNVETLEQLATSCNLEMLTFCVDQFSCASNKISWNLELADTELSSLYYALPDSTRWHITNLVLQEASPWLWFYFQRKDCPRRKRTEKEICEAFLQARFSAISTTTSAWTLGADGIYRSLGEAIPFPGRRRPNGIAGRVYERLDGRQAMRDVFAQLGLDTSFVTANLVRINLATSAFPFSCASP